MMNYPKIIFSLILLSNLFSSCSSPRYIRKSEKLVKAVYSTDTIIIHNYYFYHNVTNSWGIVQEHLHSIDEDSIISIFKNSLNRVSLSMSFDKGVTNAIDNSFHGNWRKPFDDELVRKITSSIAQDNKLYLVPLIKLENNFQTGMYFTSSGSAGGSRYLMRGKLSLIIYIVKNNSILYCRSGLFLSDLYPSYDMRETIHTLTQKDWDELVALVMKDYIERLRE